VWCAADRMLGRPVAIKLLSEPYAHDAGAVLRFKREARAAARLSSHSNVVTIFDVGETTGCSDDGSGRAFIVMAYLEGGTVADALRSGPVERIEALRWVGETAAALDYAHERGVIHRDIKPENLLLDRARVVHVADFGIARITTETPITQSGQVFGTAAYLAPERAAGEPATEASDRYSLAVVAFELLVGKRPFDAQASASQLRQHAQEQAPAASQFNPTLPPAVDAVLARGMAKRQHDRWPTAASFAAALEDAATRPAPGGDTRTLPIGIPAHRGGLAPSSGRTRPAPGLAASGALDRPRSAAPRARSGAAHSPARSASADRAADRRRTAGRVLAVLTLGAVLLGTALVVLAHRGGQSRTAIVAQKKGVARSRSQAKRPRAAASRSATTTASTTPSSSPASTSASAGSQSSASAGAQVGSTAPPQSADALNAAGYELMQRGNYSQAIPLLQQAVAKAPHESLTYAYALYNLGASYVGAGEPGRAIPILRERLLIPNQTAVVQSELAMAEQAAGIAQQPSDGAGSSVQRAASGSRDNGRNGNGNGNGGGGN
jgi:eukaryotic-like serine/threonine-protein kinase